jgi:ribosomal protein S18 acetylase RimI-like enzyme
LSKLSYAFSIICYVNNKPAGLVNCFEAFSTFKCKPLINIHDVVVVNEFRGLGLSQPMLSKVEEIAKLKGCCKITLEVLEGNKVAQKSYIKFGFAGYELDPIMGKALFWQRNV